jgi:hypothetical protein
MGRSVTKVGGARISYTIFGKIFKVEQVKKLGKKGKINRKIILASYQ